MGACFRGERGRVDGAYLDGGQLTAEGTQGMVVSVSPPGSQAGRAILRRGGNAVDAAVATALAMAVTWPEARQYRRRRVHDGHPGPGTEPVCVEYRETAPTAADASTSWPTIGGWMG